MQNPPDYRHDTVLPLPPEVKADAWAVDAGCSGNPGPMEYQCIDLQTGYRVFHFGPIKGTNNIGEFLAIVHALALCWNQGLFDKTIYSDSYNAIQRHSLGQQTQVQDKTGAYARDGTLVSDYCKGRKLAGHSQLPQPHHQVGNGPMGGDSR